MTVRKLLLFLAFTGIAGTAAAQPAGPVRLHETFAPGYVYHVSCRVDIKGTLALPADGKAGPRTLPIDGRSKIDYDERLLPQKTPDRIERTIRHYDRLEFSRKVGDEDQQSELRPEAARLVILRHKQLEAPFCPTGPLTWGEIDLVRTDVFTPALKGLLAPNPVRPGDRWPAAEEAVMELTDLEKLTSGGLTCTFTDVQTIAGRRQARVNFTGQVHGIGEDGSAAHTLDGSLYFDLDGNFLSYLDVRGSHSLLDKAGQPTGKIDGNFRLTRTPVQTSPKLADDALRGLALEPTDDNTLLLFEDAKLGARFLYPRNWRVAGVSGKQIAVDEKQGAGLLITVEPAAATPTAAQFLQEARTSLTQQKATVTHAAQPRALDKGLEGFAIDAYIAQKKVALHYYVARQSDGGATLVANIPANQGTAVHRDVERIARSVQLMRPR